MTMFKDTSDLREAMNKLYEGVEDGSVSNAAARVRVGIAKAMLDTIKVELAAASLGKQFSAVSFSEYDGAQQNIRRIK